MFVDPFGRAATGVPRVRPVWQEFDALFQALDRPGHHGAPELRVETDDSKLTLEVEAPGVREQDITVSVTGRRLDLALVREPRVPDGFTAIRQERRGWRVERSFELPFDVDARNATATLDDGVFTLTLPRVAAVEPVRITVQSKQPALTTSEEV
jgi:HSP20 family protein